MELDFVSFEQAKALEELGFPQETYDYLYLDGELISREEYYEMDCGGPFSVELFESERLSAPPLEFVAKWLRSEKNILVLPYLIAFVGISNESTPPELKTNIFGCQIVYYDTYKEGNEFLTLEEFATYEEALSAGIDNAIETLKNKKKGNEV